MGRIAVIIDDTEPVTVSVSATRRGVRVVAHPAVRPESLDALRPDVADAVRRAVASWVEGMAV